MGAIDIPANPSAPGHLSVRLQLDATEVHSLSSLLQQAVQLVGADPAGASDRYLVPLGARHPFLNQRKPVPETQDFNDVQVARVRGAGADRCTALCR